MPTAWHTTNGDDCHILPYVFLSGAHPSVQMQEATFSNQARLLFSLISPLILTLNSNWLNLYQRPAYTGGLHWGTQQCGAATDLGGPPPWKGGSSWLFTHHVKKKLRPHVSESSSQRRRQKLKGRLTKREPSWKAKVSSVVHRRTWSVGIDQKN